MEEGPEYNVPHFYADYALVKELFSNFKIINIHQEIDYYEKQNGLWINQEDNDKLLLY